MQIVIDIPDEWFNRLQEAWGWALAENVREAIKSGTILPKGHGRLKDADAIAARFKEHKKFYVDSYGGCFQFMPIEYKARCDEIDSCWADIINEPTII